MTGHYIEIDYHDEHGALRKATLGGFDGTAKEVVYSMRKTLEDAARNGVLMCAEKENGNGIFIPWHRVLLVRPAHKRGGE